MKTSAIELPAQSRITSQMAEGALRIKIPARRRMRWGRMCVLGFLGITAMMQGILTHRVGWIIAALPMLLIAALPAIWVRRQDAVEIAADSRGLTITLWSGDVRASRSCEWTNVATIATTTEPHPMLEIQLRDGTIMRGLDGTDATELEWIADQIKKRRG